MIYCDFCPNLSNIYIVGMLRFEPNVPCKETNNYLAKFPTFSMV